MTTTIYHNPDCGTSRNTLAMIRQSGVEPIVVEYLKTPPDRQTIIGLVAAAGLTLRQALRQKDTPYDALGLSDPLTRPILVSHLIRIIATAVEEIAHPVVIQVVLKSDLAGSS